MQKVKYIIIFTLLLILGIVYLQLIDYQNISSTLLDNNTKNTQIHNELKNKISSLKLENKELNNRIIILEEEISIAQLKLNPPTYNTEANSTHELFSDTKPLENMMNEKSIQLNPQPNITIDDENEITGFGLEYNQKF